MDASGYREMNAFIYHLKEALHYRSTVCGSRRKNPQSVRLMGNRVERSKNVRSSPHRSLNPGLVQKVMQTAHGQGAPSYETTHEL